MITWYEGEQVLCTSTFDQYPAERKEIPTEGRVYTIARLRNRADWDGIGLEFEECNLCYDPDSFTRIAQVTDITPSLPKTVARRGGQRTSPMLADVVPFQLFDRRFVGTM